jgi:protein PhnA
MPIVQAPSQHGLLRLAFAATALAGFVDALGFLAFGGLFLASPDANSIVAAVALADGGRVALHAGGAVLALLAGVVLTSDTLLPSVQAVRLGEALAAGGLRETRRPLAFWLVFVGGGILGAGAWFLTDRWALVLAAGFAFCAAIGARQSERFRPTDRPTPMEHEMTSDNDYVYDEESGEWMPASELAARKAAAGQIEVRDAVGNILRDGDQVVLVKDLDVKGAGKTLKVGTVIKSIRLTGDPREIDCRHEAIKGLVLRAEFVRKR